MEIFLQNYSQLCHIKNSATLIMLNNTQTYSDMWQNCRKISGKCFMLIQSKALTIA